MKVSDKTKVGLVGLGGFAIGTGLGYGMSKLLGAKPSGPPADIVEAVSHIGVFDNGGQKWLTPEWMFNFAHGTNVKAAFYAWTLSDQYNVRNPQAVMSVWVKDGKRVYEFSSQSGAGSIVYYDSIVKLTLPSSQVFSV
jgi:hypothetical protein